MHEDCHINRDVNIDRKEENSKNLKNIKELEDGHETWHLKSTRLNALDSLCNQCCHVFVINVNLSTAQ